jgi:hypothetical protein
MAICAGIYIIYVIYIFLKKYCCKSTGKNENNTAPIQSIVVQSDVVQVVVAEPAVEQPAITQPALHPKRVKKLPPLQNTSKESTPTESAPNTT